MPTPIARPTNLHLPFAASGAKNTIPEAATGSNLASYAEGFPPVCSLPLTSGGIPPEGDDFNGILNALSAHVLFSGAGGQYQFDAALSTYIGGYPHGFVLQNNAGTASYISLVDNNTTDFNTTPSAIGTLWGTFAGAAFSGATVTTTGGSTTLTAAQLASNVIVVSGALTSNVTLVFPSVLGKYFVVNKTTGLYLVNCIASGAAITIRQQGADLIYCDGVNMGYQQASSVNQLAGDASKAIATTYYADRAASRVGGGAVDTGAVDAYVIATIPVSAGAPGDYQTVRFRAAHASSGGAATLNIGGGAYPLVTGDGANPRPNDISNTAITTATFVASLSKWIINGLIVPDILISNAIYVDATRTLVKGNFIFNTAAGPFGCTLNASPNIGDTVYGADPTGDWKNKPLTIIAAGANIAFKDKYGTLQTMTSFVDDIAGHSFKLVYDGTYWRLA